MPSLGHHLAEAVAYVNQGMKNADDFEKLREEYMVTVGSTTDEIGYYPAGGNGGNGGNGGCYGVSSTPYVIPSTKFVPKSTEQIFPNPYLTIVQPTPEDMLNNLRELVEKMPDGSLKQQQRKILAEDAIVALEQLLLPTLQPSQEDDE